MTLGRDQLEQRWQEAAGAPLGGREWRAVALPVSAPVAMLVGVREPDGRLALLLEAPLAMTASALFRLQAEGMSVVDQRRPEEGIRRLAITLEREELHSVFAALALDVVDVATSTRTPPEALRTVVARLEAWQSCLRTRRSRLSDHQQIGLLGELEVLRLAIPAVGGRQAVDWWQGPLDGLHDFTGAGTAIEVKSALGPEYLLRISTPSQLSTSGLARLAIARPRFREDPAGTRLADVVEDIRRDLGREAPSAVREYDEKLLRAGFIAADADPGLRVVLEDLYGFEVRDGFPRIGEADIPPAISEVAYAVDERFLGNFRLGIGEIGTLVERLAAC